MIESTIELCRAFRIANAIYMAVALIVQCLSAMGNEPFSLFDEDDESDFPAVQSEPDQPDQPDEADEPTLIPFSVSPPVSPPPNQYREPADCPEPVDYDAIPEPTDDPQLQQPAPAFKFAKPRPQQPMNTVKPKPRPRPVAPLPPHVAAPQTFFASMQRAVRFAPDAHERMQSLIENQEERKIKLIGLAPTWCGPCWETPPTALSEGVPRKTSPVSYLSHPMIEIEWRAEAYSTCEVYPAVFDPATEGYHFGPALKSGDELVSRLNHQRSLSGAMLLSEPAAVHSFGTIEKSYIKNLFDGLKDIGDFNISNKRQTMPINSMLSANIPADMSLRWTTADRAFKVVFIKKPTVLTREISGATITSKGVTLNIDWFPDIALEFR